MTDEKYIQNQIDFIKRERRIIFRKHWMLTSFLLPVLLFFVLMCAQYEHPDNWHSTTITFSKVEKSLLIGRYRWYKLYDSNGICYGYHRDTYINDGVPTTGQEYSIVYADNLFGNILAEMKDGQQEYVNYDAALKRHKDLTLIWWIFIILTSGALIGFNISTYRYETNRNFRNIKRYKMRIKEKEQIRTPKSMEE